MTATSVCDSVVIFNTYCRFRTCRNLSQFATITMYGSSILLIARAKMSFFIIIIIIYLTSVISNCYWVYPESCRLLTISGLQDLTWTLLTSHFFMSSYSTLHVPFYRPPPCSYNHAIQCIHWLAGSPGNLIKLQILFPGLLKQNLGVGPRNLF